MTQQEVLDLIYNARTLPTIKKAEQAVAAWVKQHPDDKEVRGTAELLIRTKQALQD